MPDEKFIWCRNCDEVHHVTPFDKAPLYHAARLEDEGLNLDDWGTFMNRHAGHRVEALHSEDRALWEGSSLDPMQERFLQVTNGQQEFVVRAFRRSIEEPLRFELEEGRLTAKKVMIEIQETAIRKEMQKHFSWGKHQPSDTTIEAFVVLFKQLVRCLSPEEFQISRYDCADVSVGYSGLDDAIVKGLLKECALHFSPDELADLKRFLETQKHSDGVMALRIKHQYGIEKAVGLSVSCDSK